MAKLYFRYGAMGSSKTANALMVRYNYLERGSKAHLLKPKLENRDGEKIIRSRIGLEAECDFVEDFIEEIGQDWEKARIEQLWYDFRDDAYKRKAIRWCEENDIAYEE